LEAHFAAHEFDFRNRPSVAGAYYTRLIYPMAKVNATAAMASLSNANFPRAYLFGLA
jgi:hypothetical protein